MFILGIFIGIYSYIIFALGLLGLLFKPVIIIISFLLIGLLLFRLIKIRRKYFNFTFLKFLRRQGRLFLLLVFLFVCQACVNLVGAMGPELGFDALWYHLMLPKIYLIEHSVFYIPGGLLYYSAMPKLAEMLFIGGLAFGDEILVKQIHFVFGLLSCFALYKIQRKFFSPFLALLGVVIFYSNLVIAWESSAAYVDLVRTFYELMALWGFVNWLEKKDRKWLWLCAAMIGFAITTKLLAIGSLGIFTVLLALYQPWRSNLGENLKNLVRLLIPFWLIALIIPLPWFIFSYVNTGNPVYPLFSSVLQEHSAKIFSFDLINPIQFLQTTWDVAVRASDPISPVYIIVLPLLVLYWRKLTKMKVFFVYGLLSFLLWYITAKVEGSRLLLPGLTAFTVLSVACVNEVLNAKKLALLGKCLLVVIIFVAFISIGYRFAANKKYFPFIFGQQTKQQFLEQHLNFSFGDFYDTDGYFRTQIKSNDKVLLYGFHNLYYIDFPFIHETWLNKADTFNYIAVQKTVLPDEYKDWKLIYQNDKTMVKLYKR